MIKIIAELGVNHGGDASLATKMIMLAEVFGADAVKLQLFDCEKLDPPGERREMLRKLQLSHDDHRDLKSYADSIGIEYICTPFDVDSLRFLVDDLKVKTLKIASGNLDNVPLLEAAGESGCEVILSTGMATINEALRGANTVYSAGAKNHMALMPILLHCTSAYPTPMEAVNLSAMVAMAENHFKGCHVGLSDHTDGISIPIAAAALGAVVIEKHLTLDRSMPGPDHAASIEPDQFAAMVRGIRDVEMAMGGGVKGVRECEYPAMKIANERREWRDR